MCQKCNLRDFAHGTRSAASTLSSMIVRQGIDLPTAVERLKALARTPDAVSNMEPLDAEELSYLDSMVDAAATLLSESAQALRETAERMSPTIPDTTEGLIP